MLFAGCHTRIIKFFQKAEESVFQFTYINWISRATNRFYLTLVEQQIIQLLPIQLLPLLLEREEN